MSALAAISFPVSLWIAVSQCIFRFFFLEISNKANLVQSISCQKFEIHLTLEFVTEENSKFDSYSNCLIVHMRWFCKGNYDKRNLHLQSCKMSKQNVLGKHGNFIILGCFYLKSDPEGKHGSKRKLNAGWMFRQMGVDHHHPLKTSTWWSVNNATFHLHFSFRLTALFLLIDFLFTHFMNLFQNTGL